jgi:O-antigen/teichoic acid export membrane protein
MISDSTAYRIPDVKKTLARNTAWNYTGFIVNFATNLVLFPFVVRRVGDSAAGIWLLLGSITGYMGLLELGIVPALTQHAASALARGGREEVNRAGSTALVLLVAMMAVALQALWWVPTLVDLVNVPADLRSLAIAVFGVSITGFALRMPLAALQGLLLGCQRQDRANQLWIVQGVVKATGTFLLLWSGHGILSVVILEAATPLASGVLQWRWIREELPNLKLSWRIADFTHARSLVFLGGTLLLGSVCALIIEQTDRLVIGARLPIAQVTHYTAAWKLYSLVATATTTLVQAVAPLAGSLHGQRDLDGLRRLMLTMTKYVAAMALPLAIGLSLSAGTLLQLWMGASYTDARLVVIVLCAYFAVSAYNHAGYSVLIGMRRVTWFLWLYSVPFAVLKVIFTLWLVGSLGNVGVALGTAIPAFLLEYVFLRLLLHELDIRWNDFFRQAVWPTALPAALTFTPLALVFLYAGPVTLALPGVAAVCGLLYASLFWTRSLGRAERSHLMSLVPGPLQRLTLATPQGD